MFPARSLVSLDDHPGEEVLRGLPPEQIINEIPGMRIVGLLHQAECITAFAMDIFKDIANEANNLFARVKKIEQKTAEIEQLLPNAITSFQNVVKERWPTNPPSYYMVGTPVDGDAASKDFVLARPSIIEEVFNRAEPQPDLSKFSQITTGMDPTTPTTQVNFDVFFSDPQFFQRQYKEEVIKNMLEEQRKKKEEARKRKEELKKEKETIKERKDKATEGGGKGSDDFISAIAQPPPRPIALVVPPPKGQAHHGDRPISLMGAPASAQTTFKPQLQPIGSPQKTVSFSTTPAPVATPSSVPAPPPPPPPPPAAPTKIIELIIDEETVKVPVPPFPPAAPIPPV